MLNLVFHQDRYRELLRTSRLWRHLKHLKWHGFGHSPVEEPGPGGLALFCAVCPQPGVNLPENWKDDPEQWVPVPCTFWNVHVVLMYENQVEIHQGKCL